MNEELKVIVRAEVTQALRDLGMVQKQTDNTEGKFKQFSKRAGEIGSTLSRTLTPAILGAGIASIKFAADIEKQQVALATMLKDADRAQALYEEWQQFSASTPFQLDEITNAGKALIAFGENAEDVTETIKRIGDVSAGIGAPLGEIAEIYGKARVQQQLFAEDLNQLAGRGIPIFDELAKVMGVNASEVKKLGSEGKITFDYLEEVFVNLTKEGGQFSGMMEELSETTAGKFSTAVDNLKLAAAELGKELLPLIKDLLDFVTNAVKGFADLDEGTKKLIIGFAALAAATGPLLKAFSLLAAHPVVAGLVALTGVIVGASMELSGLRENAIQTNLKLGLFNKTLEQLGRQSGLEDVSATVIEMADKFGLSFEHAASLAKEQGLIVDNLDRIVSRTEDQSEEEEAILVAAADQAAAALEIADAKKEITTETENERDALEEIRRLERARAEAWSETQLMYSRTAQGRMEELRQEYDAYKAALDAYNAGVDNPAGAAFNITNEQTAGMVEAILSYLAEQLESFGVAVKDAGDEFETFGADIDQSGVVMQDTLGGLADEFETFGADIDQSGVVMSDMLGGLGEDFETFGADIDKAGEIMRGEIVPAAQAAAEKLRLMREALSGVGAQVGKISNVAKYIEKLNNELKDAMNSIADLLQRGFVDLFEDLGDALVTGADGMQSIKDSLKDMMAEFLSQQAEMLLSAGLMTLLSGNIPVGLALIAASGLVAIVGGAIGSDGGGSNLSTYEQYILDAEQDLMDQRLDLLREQADKERELMNDKLDMIESKYSDELYLLRRLLDANVISQGEYTQRVEGMQAERFEEEAAARAPFEEAQAAAEAEQAMREALADAKTQKLAQLSQIVIDAQTELDDMGFLEKLFTGRDRQLSELISSTKLRIKAVKDALTIDEVYAAKDGADFISQSTGLLQYHPNEHVQVTPAPKTNSGVVVNFNGNVYGDEDAIAKAVTDAVERAQGRRRLA